MYPSSQTRFSPSLGFAFLLSSALFLCLAAGGLTPAYAFQENTDPVIEESGGPTVVSFGEPSSEETTPAEEPSSGIGDGPQLFL